MRLWGALQSAVPVVSHSTERRRTPEPPHTPDSGRRWGKPSAFSFSIAAAQRADSSPAAEERCTAAEAQLLDRRRPREA